MATGRGIAFVRTQITLIESMANREADEHLWNRFFDLYYSAMVKYAEMFCASHDAEDIVQRVLVKLVGILKSGRYERRPGVRFRSYLMTLIRHEFIDWRREETARGLGMNTAAMRVLFLLLAAALAGAAVSMAGLLSFVGLLVPHAVRRLGAKQTKHLLPLCALFGAGFVTLCDTAARTWFAPYELPVGILMAFLGAPFFVWILLRSKGGHARA